MFPRRPRPVPLALALLAAPAAAQLATVHDQVELSDTEGGFGGTLANADVFGRAVASLGDLDGDGIGDVAVSANGDSVNGPNRGAVWILFLNADGTVKAQQKIDETTGGFGGTLLDGDRFGRSLVALGDLNGDGRSELAVGAHLDDDGGAFQDRGAVWILFLNANGTVANQTKISQTSGGFGGTLEIADQFGLSLAALGDLDGNGVPDLAVGADRDDDGAGGMDLDLGAIWILFLDATGSVIGTQKISNTQGGFTGALDLMNRDVGVGANGLAAVGDVDGDGVVDLLSGETGSARGSDTLWLLFLNPNGTVKNYSRIGSGFGGFPALLEAGDGFGGALAALGDLNGDGRLEVAVGANGDDDGGSGRGAVWLLSFDASGTVVDWSKISQTSGGFGGLLVDDDRFGGALAGLGDRDGNGTPDLIVGAHLSDDGGDRRGSAWIVELAQSSVAPLFTSTCGDTRSTNAGQELAFLVSVDDADPGDVVTLSATGLPPGATTFPALPAATTSTLVRWTPSGSDVGPHPVSFTATDSFGNTATCALTLEVVAGECPTAQHNRREPGSLLLFPEFQNGPGRVTLLTVTNTNCDFFDGNVAIEYRYIAGEDCSKRDHTAQLTPCDTVSLLTSVHTGDDRGFAYVYAKSLVSSDANANGEPIAFDHLVGQELVIDSWRAFDYSINAVAFQAPGEEGAQTDLDADGVRDLDGAEYTAAPERILIPRFLGNDSGEGARVWSELLLIGLSGGRDFRATPINPAGGTSVDFLVYNDDEEVFSAEYRFDCWDKVKLEDVSTIFLNESLANLTNHDPSEIAGANGLESGWMVLDGGVASSVADSILDPAIYAVLIEHVRGTAAADLPFELCSQTNGDLLPLGIFGDGPNAGPGDGE